MELRLRPERQWWHMERFIPHRWPWGERGHQITPQPHAPRGLSIWGKLLLVGPCQGLFSHRRTMKGNRSSIDWTFVSRVDEKASTALQVVSTGDEIQVFLHLILMLRFLHMKIRVVFLLCCRTVDKNNLHTWTGKPSNHIEYIGLVRSVSVFPLQSFSSSRPPLLNPWLTLSYYTFVFGQYLKIITLMLFVALF